MYYLRCALLVCSIFVTLTVAAQKWDSTYSTTYYNQKVSVFRLLPDTPGEIIFLGNSITDIGEWAELWQNPNVKNRGISGDNTFGVLARLDEVLSSKPRMVFVMIGINDIARNIPDSVILFNYQRILQRVKTESPATKLVFQSVLPTNNNYTEFKNHQNKTEHILAVNKGLQELCAKESITFVDLYPHFINAEGKLDPRYTNDGLHLTGEGYILWKSVLQQLKLF